MELREQKYILAIARCKTLSGAAETLHISQPALSTFLSKLEKSLGGELFFRQGRKVEPTLLGKLYIDAAVKIVEVGRQFELEASRLFQNQPRTLRIGLQQLRAPHLIPVFLVKFKERMPNLSIEFSEGLGDSLKDFLEKGTVDIIVTSDHGAFEGQKEIRRRKLREDHLLLIAPKGKKLPLSGPENEVELSLVQDENFIMTPKEHSVRQLVDKKLKELGLELSHTIMVNRQEAAIRLAAMDQGLTFTLDSYLPYFHIPTPVDSYPVKDVSSVDYCFFYLENKLQTSFLKEISEVLKEIFKQAL